MSRTVDRAPFDITSDGAAVLNVAGFDVPKRLRALVRLARKHPGTVFLSVAFTRPRSRTCSTRPWASR